MGTRAAAFTAKIKNLQDAQIRLMQGPTQGSGQSNPPSGVELATTLKWFSTTLLNVLKDVPGQPFVMMKSKENDPERMALYPSLDYKGLYSTLINFYDLIPKIAQGLFDFGKAFLNTLCSLVPFLERELIDTLPYNVCAMLTILPASLSQDIINVVCWHLIPFTINTRRLRDNLPLSDDSDINKENYASKSSAAILMMVFQFAKDNTAIHRQITEALMAVKEDLVKDLLCVVAHGTPSARQPGANLLFYYWPSLNPTLYDLKAVINKFNSCDSWVPPLCCAPECAGKGSALAVKMCLDHTICMAHHPDKPPPGFYCRDCFLTIQRLIDGRDVSPMFQDINHPMQQVSITCDNQKCKSIDKTAVAICFSQDCASFNGTDHRPTRYCKQCNKINHQSRLTMDHIIHSTLPSPWDMDQETQNYLVKAVVSLLKEARPFGSSSNREQEEAHRRTMQVLDDEDDVEVEDEATLNERRLLSRYGVWLLVGLSTPNPDTHLPTFGHMLSMLFQWFNATAYLPNDKTGTALEKLKSEYIPEWLQNVHKSHPDVFVYCLLPNPPDSAKIGGHWDMFLPKIDHIKEGLTRFFCLVPYDVITLEVWDKVMSHWMEAINKEVSRDDLPELKSIFCKIFDPDMSPLGFDAQEMYLFISKRFKRTLAEVQQQALQWLQKLCLMNIHIPMEILFDMFNDGVDSLHKDGLDLDPKGPTLIQDATSGCKSEDDILDGSGSLNGDIIEEAAEEDPPLVSKEELNLTCYNLMIDVLTSQMEQQDIEKHVGLLGPKASDVLGLLNKMLATPWMTDINRCLVDTVDFDDLEEDEEFGIRAVEELLTDFLQLSHITIRNIISLDTNSDSDDEGCHDTVHATIHSESGDKAAALKKNPGLGQFMAVLSTMQSTVEKVKEADESSSESSQEDSDEPFVLKIEDYKVELQLVYHLLLRNTEVADADMRYYLLDSVRLLSLNAEVLQGAARKQKKFLNYCQEPLLTGIIWAILDAAHSQVAQAAVPILLHSITLPGGADIFWKALDDDFNNEDWRVRFSAVEKVTLMFRFLEDRPVKKSAGLRSVLTHAFCCLIASMDDINVHVSQRSTLHMGTNHDRAIETLMWSLEYQFDTVSIDRPVILKRLYQLFNSLIERRILSWQFFASRFDVVLNEIQSVGDKPDLTGRAGTAKKSSTMASAASTETSISQHTSLRNRLQQRSGTDSISSVRSLASSLKYPYKRTISAPAGMGLSTASKHNIQVNSKTQSNYYRQQSVPMMLRAKYGKTLNDSGHQLNKQISNVGAVMEEMEYMNVAAKTLDMDEIDKESLHLLVFLFMQFLSHTDQAFLPPSSEEKRAKVHPMTRCFQSLYSLLGYNENERRFQVMPHKIRATPSVNAFLAYLPQVLDYNYQIGENMILSCILILQKIPFPPRYAATSWQQAHTLMQESHMFQGCGFSLWYLEPSLRKNWLLAVLVIFYKYDFNCDTVIGEKSIGLIRIILHTLNAHAHACDRYNRPTYGQAARSRDLSQLSIGETENQEPMDGFEEPDTPEGEEGDEEEEGEEEEESEDENDPELQPIFEKTKSDSSTSPEKTSEQECFRAMVETNPNPPVSEDDNNVRTPMANLFGFLPRPSGGQKAPTPDNHQLTSGEGLPPGWTMQLMRNGRTLFIDNTNQITTWIDPRTGRPAEIKDMPKNLPTFESPPSPLSLMDVITVGSPVAVDRSQRSGTSSSSAVTVTSPGSQLDLPTEERLLTIGGGGGGTRPKRGEQHSRERIIDRVWQVFGSMEPGQQGESIPLIEEKVTSERIQVVASIHKQDSTCSDTERHTTTTTVTECYVGHVTHIRNGFSKADSGTGTQSTTPNPVAAPMSKEKEQITVPIQRPHQQTSSTQLQAGPKPPEGVKKSSLKKKGEGRNSDKSESKVVDVQAPPPKEKPKLKKKRKQGTSNLPDQSGLDSSSKASSVCGKNRENSSSSLLSGNRDNPLLMKQSALRIGEDSIVDRCSFCGVVREEYSEDELGHCVIVLSTFINREPGLAAPLLPEILLTVTRIARMTQYSWEPDSNAFIPSNSRSISRQFIRCVLHQLSGNGIFSKLFLMEMEVNKRQKFFNTLVQCLLDFTELNPSAPVALFMQEMNDKKTLSLEDFDVCLPNLACYFKCTQFEVASKWGDVFGPSEIFFRRLWALTGTPVRQGANAQANQNTSGNKLVTGKHDLETTIQLPQIEALFHIMTSVLRMPGVYNNRLVLDPLAKLLSYTIQNCAISFTQLVAICHFCNRGFIKERDKQLLTRTACYELVQALKFKTCIPDANFLMLTNFILLDLGGQLSTGSDSATFPNLELDQPSQTYNTAASEVMRTNMTDVLEFMADVHTLSKVKSNCKGMTIGLNEDTLGGILKAGLSQYLALEISNGNGRDSRTVNKYLPWLFNPPGNTATQGPKEFLDCVAHIRLLSWLLLGAVNHTLKFGNNESVICQPIPLEASCHIADHVQVILAGFAEQSKTSVVHMCSLFHAFILCQLWTVYLEQTIVLLPNKDESQILASSILLDFWGKVTPGILQLVSHSKVLAEMVNLHFLSLMEAFMECHSTILAKLMPLWTPVLFAYHTQLPDHVRVRLQAIQDYKPTDIGLDEQTINNMVLVKWLQRLQFKMGQIEMQASNVTQFFTV